jgi:hypothetical protein
VDDEEEAQAHVKREKLAREKEEASEEAMEAAAVATRARQLATPDEAVAARRAREDAAVLPGVGVMGKDGGMVAAARSPGKRKWMNPAAVGTPVGVVIKMMPTAGLVTLNREVVKELEDRLSCVEE